MLLNVYDINPYFETEAKQNCISFCTSYFYNQNCSFKIDIRLEYNCNVKVSSVRAKACSCDFTLSKYEDEKSNGNMLKHVNEHF